MAQLIELLDTVNNQSKKQLDDVQGDLRDIRSKNESNGLELVKLIELLDTVNNQFKKQMEAEQDYLIAINMSSDSNRVNIIRHCFNRLPSSFALLEKLWAVQKKQLEEIDDAQYRREIIRDMNNAVTLYRQSCLIAYIDKADSIVESLEKHSESVMKDLRNKEKNGLLALIKQLQVCVKKLESNSNDKTAIADIESIDAAIDKVRLNTFVDLSKKYKLATEKLLSIFQSDSKGGAKKNDDKKEKQYNLNAIANHKDALAKFNKDNEFMEENNFKKGLKLDELVSLLGSWDLRYLYPSTISYTNNVYNHIFSKLKPDSQLKITELMVKMNKKPL